MRRVINDAMINDIKVYAETMTSLQIAAKLNVNKKTLWCYLKEAGIKPVSGRLKQNMVTECISRGELPNYRVIPGIAGTLTMDQIKRLKEHVAPVSLDLVYKCVCEYLCIDKEEVISQSQKREKVWARQIFFYLSYKLSGQSWKKISAFMGGRDHTTAIYANNTCKDLIDTDKELERQVREIEGMIKNRLK